MRHIDTSSLVDLWEYYPNSQFPTVWEWIVDEFLSRDLVICEVAYEESRQRIPECVELLKSHTVPVRSMSADDLEFAKLIKSELGIIEEKYGKGVGEKDLLIVGSAKMDGADLITSETQGKPPDNRVNWKMPSVCRLPCVGVTTLTMLEYIYQSKRTF